MKWHRIARPAPPLRAHGAAGKFGKVNVPPGEDAELPVFISDYLERDGVELGSGAVIVWVLSDRLTYNQATTVPV
jgi:hypothetical protein